MDFGDFGDFGFLILGIWDFGDLGFWIFGTLCSRSLRAKFGFWNLEILDFGDFGFWILGILDFGFWWFLEFGGLGILDWQVVTKFWMLHKKRRLCTPTRVGRFVPLGVLAVVTASCGSLRCDWFFQGKHGPYCQSCAKKLGNMTLAFCFLAKGSFFLQVKIKLEIWRSNVWTISVVQGAAPVKRLFLFLVVEIAGSGLKCSQGACDEQILDLLLLLFV